MVHGALVRVIPRSLPLPLPRRRRLRLPPLIRRHRRLLPLLPRRRSLVPALPVPHHRAPLLVVIARALLPQARLPAPPRLMLPLLRLLSKAV